jgi:Tfp pilus assembly protein PilN
MINLLPPSIKEQIAYSKRNTVLMHYLRMTVLVGLSLAAILAGALMYAKQQANAAETEALQKQAQAAAMSDVEVKAKALAVRVNSIKTIQSNRPRFSGLLSDLSQALPGGTALSGVNLSGDEKRPLAISATADSYNTAVALRDTLASSSRFQQVDLQSVTSVAPRVFRVELVASFRPGRAK